MRPTAVMRAPDHVRWLHDELPELVAEGILDDATAARLRARYPRSTRDSRALALLVFGVLGACLVGGGMLLLIAHNWDGLSRGVRAVLALSPLLACQGLAAWVLLRRAASQAWRESVGVAWALSLGAALALIAQTYHVASEVERFASVWLLLGLPIAYLLRARLVLLLYWIGISAIAGATPLGMVPGLAYWVGALLSVPLLVWLVRVKGSEQRTRWVMSAVALSLPTAGAVLVIDGLRAPWLIFYGALLPAMAMAGLSRYERPPRAWSLPLTWVGACGVAVLALVSSHADSWTEVEPVRALDAADTGLLLACIAVGGVAAGFLPRHWQQRDLPRMLVSALPPLVFVAYLLADVAAGVVIAIVAFNLYLLALGMALLVAGLRQQRMGLANAGLLLLGALFTLRFFDAELGFVARGVAFIVLGTVFIAINVWLARRRTHPQGGGPR